MFETGLGSLMIKNPVTFSGLLIYRRNGYHNRISSAPVSTSGSRKPVSSRRFSPLHPASFYANHLFTGVFVLPPCTGAPVLTGLKTNSCAHSLAFSVGADNEARQPNVDQQFQCPRRLTPGHRFASSVAFPPNFSSVLPAGYHSTRSCIMIRRISSAVLETQWSFPFQQTTPSTSEAFNGSSSHTFQ